MSGISTSQNSYVEIDINFDIIKGSTIGRWQILLNKCEKMAERLPKTINWQKSSICE